MKTNRTTEIAIAPRAKAVAEAKAGTGVVIVAASFRDGLRKLMAAFPAKRTVRLTSK